MFLHLLLVASSLFVPVQPRSVVGVGLYNSSTYCPSNCNCPDIDNYDGVSLLLFQLNSAGELGYLAGLKVGLNVSWAVSHPSLPVIYTLSELTCFRGNATGSISAWVVDGSEARPLSRVSSQGAAPVHLLTIGDKGLIASDYLGNVVVFALNGDGSLGGTSSFHSSGFGTHSTALDPSMRFAFTPVLGSDQLLQWIVQNNTLVTNPTQAVVQLDTGLGPRHMAFHPTLPLAFVADEGSGNATRLTVCKLDTQTGSLSVLQTISVTNVSAPTTLYPAEVIVSADGHFLYVSVRDINGKQDSVAVLSIGPSGELALLTNTPTAWYPRSMALFSSSIDYLLVGAQKARVLQTFSVDRATGLLRDLHRDILFADSVAFVGEL